MNMNKWLGLCLCLLFFSACTNGQETLKPRVLVSTDIGGTDPDDNQSVTHLLMYFFVEIVDYIKNLIHEFPVYLHLVLTK